MAAFSFTSLTYDDLMVIDDVVFQILQRSMYSKALEVDFGVIMGNTHADRGVSQSVEIKTVVCKVSSLIITRGIHIDRR